MARRDGTGPAGQGPMTGRGLGFCTGAIAGDRRFGLGRGIRRGLGVGVGLGLLVGCGRRLGRCFMEESEQLSDKDVLTEQKELLEKRLDTVNNRLENL